MIGITISTKKYIIICWLTTTLFHSTSCNAARSSLYFDNSLHTVLSKPAPDMPCSKLHVNCHYPKSFQRVHTSLSPCVTFRDMLAFLTVRIFHLVVQKVEDHSLPAVRDCLFNIFVTIPNVWKAGHAMVAVIHMRVSPPKLKP